MKAIIPILAILAAGPSVAADNTQDGIFYPTAMRQTETDEYTRYELLGPQSASFKIDYEVTATTAGAQYFYNPIRKGSVASDESVYDVMTGTADATAHVVVFPFPAVQAGQSMRLRISETYTAPVSYTLDGDELVFDRSLGRPRNAVVLPSGWYLTASAAPATVSQLPDGRVRLDFWDERPEAVDVLIRARRRVD